MWFLREYFMKVPHHILGIVAVGGREPLIVHIQVSLPFDQVLDHSSSHPQVQYFLHLVLLMVIDDV